MGVLDDAVTRTVDLVVAGADAAAVALTFPCITVYFAL